MEGHKTGGRKKGTPNKATIHAREAISRFVDGNAHKLQEWLDQIAESDGPKAAAAMFMELVEFAVPKLARTEMVGKDGGAVKIEISGTDSLL